MLQAISERAIEINSLEDYDYGYRQAVIKECGQHHTEHCMECAQACKECAEECRKMAA